MAAMAQEKRSEVGRKNNLLSDLKARLAACEQDLQDREQTLASLRKRAAATDTQDHAARLMHTKAQDLQHQVVENEKKKKENRVRKQKKKRG